MGTVAGVTTWYTSDLHLGHGNILGYCARPFPHVDAMDDALVASWNAQVADGDEVWVLGDFCLGDVDAGLSRVAGLRGVKRLVVGNHDRPFGGRPDADAWEARYLAAGFASLHHGWVPHAPADAPELGGVLLCHFPYTGDSRSTDRFADRRPPDDGGVLLHGHVHGRWRRRGRLVDVGVDAWGGRPVAASEVAALLAGPPDAAPLVWPPPTPRRP